MGRTSEAYALGLFTSDFLNAASIGNRTRSLALEGPYVTTTPWTLDQKWKRVSIVSEIKNEGLFIIFNIYAPILRYVFYEYKSPENTGFLLLFYICGYAAILLFLRIIQNLLHFNYTLKWIIGITGRISQFVQIYYPKPFIFVCIAVWMIVLLYSWEESQCIYSNISRFNWIKYINIFWYFYLHLRFDYCYFWKLC